MKWILAVLSVFLAAPSHAEDVFSRTDMMMVQGKCVRLVLEGIDLTGTCADQAASHTEAPDRVLFHFGVADDTAISLVGTDLPNPTPDTDEIKLIRFHVSSRHGALQAGPHEADGKCTFGNPYMGKATIQCIGRSNGKDLTVLFETDGSEPVKPR